MGLSLLPLPADPALRRIVETLNGILTGQAQLPGVRLNDGVAVPATLPDGAEIYVDTADGDLKVKFSDGTVKTIVTDT